jgi:hypothetical protein
LLTRASQTWNSPADLAHRRRMKHETTEARTVKKGLKNGERSYKRRSRGEPSPTPVRPSEKTRFAAIAPVHFPPPPRSPRARVRPHAMPPVSTARIITPPPPRPLPPSTAFACTHDHARTTAQANSMTAPRLAPLSPPRSRNASRSVNSTWPNSSSTQGAEPARRSLKRL